MKFILVTISVNGEPLIYNENGGRISEEVVKIIDRSNYENDNICPICKYDLDCNDNNDEICVNCRINWYKVSTLTTEKYMHLLFKRFEKARIIVDIDMDCDTTVQTHNGKKLSEKQLRVIDLRDFDGAAVCPACKDDLHYREHSYGACVECLVDWNDVCEMDQDEFVKWCLKRYAPK